MNSEFKRALLGLMISHIPKELKSEYQNSHTDSLQQERRPKCCERKNGSRSPGPLRPEGTGQGIVKCMLFMMAENRISDADLH
jgi:hypothetical protein